MILFGRVRHVLAERRNHVDRRVVGQQIVEQLGQTTDPAMRPGDVGRQKQHSLRPAADPPAGLVDHLEHQFLQAFRTDRGGLFVKPGHRRRSPVVVCGRSNAHDTFARYSWPARRVQRAKVA
jgi:hypothetical protein